MGPRNRGAVTPTRGYRCFTFRQHETKGWTEALCLLHPSLVSGSLRSGKDPTTGAAGRARHLGLN